MDNKSLKSVFNIYMSILETYIDCIGELYHSCFVNDVKSYQTIMLKRVVKSLKTLNQVLGVSKDPISAYTLLRTIADSVCSYCFIYENESKEEVEFRHYLFLLDGCSQFVNAFPSSFTNSELIEETEEAINQMETDQEKTNLVTFQKHLLLYIKCTSVVSSSPKETEDIIRNRDWKYRDVVHYLKKESYSWQDIYEKAGADYNMMNFFSVFLSQYVHGLFLSNTKNPNLKIHYNLIYDVAITLERRLISAIKNCFKEDNIDLLMLKHIDLNKINDIYRY